MHLLRRLINDIDKIKDMEISTDRLVIILLSLLIIMGSIKLLSEMVNYFTTLGMPGKILIILGIIIFVGNLHYMIIKVSLGQP